MTSSLPNTLKEQLRQITDERERLDQLQSLQNQIVEEERFFKELPNLLRTVARNQKDNQCVVKNFRAKKQWFINQPVIKDNPLISKIVSEIIKQDLQVKFIRVDGWSKGVDGKYPWNLIVKWSD